VEPELTPSINREQLRPDAVILDVREDDEWAAGHIEGAVHVPVSSVADRMAYEPGPLLIDQPIVVTCKGGGRATRVTAWLNANGFEAVNLEGGMLGWESAGRPMVAEGDQPPTVI
jgi:rhodanese-related sulfurtransferase